MIQLTSRSSCLSNGIFLKPPIKPSNLMAVKIVLFHEWIKRYPKKEWDEIKNNLFDSVELPADAIGKFSLVRVMSGSKAKLGVVSAKDAPHIKQGHVLWLRTAHRQGNPHYFMRATSGWAGKVSNIIRYYTEDGGFGYGHQYESVQGLI